MRPTAAEPTIEGRLQFALLGPMRVELDGHEVELGARMLRALLAILVLDAGRVVPADRLIDVLWREEPPSAAIASVQAYVSRLRRALEPNRPPRGRPRVLLTLDPGYLLRAEDDQVDTLRFQVLARQAHHDLAAGRVEAAAATLDAALALWRGDPLPEFAAEPWAVAAVAGLTEAHDLAMEDLVDAWLGMGAHAQAAAELETMVEERPLRERRWAQLIVASYRCGRQADALRAYQRCRAVIAEELGLEPGAELRRLEAAVLAHDPSLSCQPGQPGDQPRASAPAQADRAPLELHGAERRNAAADPERSLVGRTAELAHLRDRLAQLARGEGGAVVLVGEPGAGKTTLAEAAARLAQGAGFTVAWGRCPDAVSTPANWPWSQVLRALPDGPLVKAARQRLGGEVAVDGEEGVRQFLAYEALAGALVEAGDEAPILVVVDDLHAADDASLALVQLLAGDLHRQPVLVLVTVRDTESSRTVGQSVGELLRHPGAERLTVGAFDESDVAALVERLTAQPPQTGVAAALVGRTGGNPFYTAQLVRLISGERRGGPLTSVDVLRRDVPTGITEVLRRRVERLPEGSQSLLSAAAVAGRDLRPDLLERLTDRDTEQLLFDLEPTIAAGLVTPDEGGWSFRFRHPLIHESLYADVGQVDRARMHARVAAELEAISSANTADVVQLAYHYLSAGPFGDPAKAVRFARQAAARASDQGAWLDAVRHLEQALEAISAAMPGADATRCDVLVELGQARRSAGTIREAHRAFDESIRLADRIGDENRSLAAAVAFAVPQMWGPREWGDTDPRLIALLERQLDRVGDGDRARRVRILSTLANELYFDTDVDQGWLYAQEALDLARRLGDPDELGIAVSAYLWLARLSEQLEDVELVLDEMLSVDGPRLSTRGRVIVEIHRLRERIRFAEFTLFDAEFEPAWRIAADELHSPELQGQLRIAQALRFMVTGEVERGVGLLEPGYRSLQDLAAVWGEPGRFVLDSSQLLATGTLAEHADRFAARLIEPEHPSVPHLAAPAAALAYAQRGDVERARDIAGRWFTPPPRSWTWFQAISYWAQVAVEVGTPDPDWLYARLAPHTGEVAIVGSAGVCGGAVDSLLGGLAWRLGRVDEAAALARSGLELDSRVGAQIWIDRSQVLRRRIASG